MFIRLTTRRAALLAAAAFAVVAGLHVPVQGQRPAPSAAAAGPNLAVIITVDQMRADYVDRFRADWTHGLKRLVAQGAWFRRAAYPYLTTVTCAGHATIGTGTLPHVHGVIQNAWWDRERQQLVTCTQDPAVHNIGYGIHVPGGDSGFRLARTTFADTMRTDRHAQVVSLSLKARSAIMPAGHGGVVTWASDAGDGWSTSTAFSSAPIAEVSAFVAANPVDADFGKTWTRMLPAERYPETDDGEAEEPPAGWTSTFPHVLKGNSVAPDPLYRVQWQRSPFADAYLGRFAAALVESMKLGQHATTDVLAVSFSSPDLVGHAFGPRSQEVRDMYAHLDETIGTLLDRLDAIVGKDRYVVALTGDHGITPLAEQLKREGRDAGRLDAAAVGKIIEQEAQAALGAGKYVTRVNFNDVYFEPGMYAKLAAVPEATKTVVTAVAAMPGIAEVFTGEEVRGGAQSKDPLLRAAALGYFEGRSGDLILAPKPGWEFSAAGATHGTAAEDDQRVPILLMGYGIKPGEYTQPATPADIAPTLAAICGVGLQAAEGQVLSRALKNAPARGRAAPPRGIE